MKGLGQQLQNLLNGFKCVDNFVNDLQLNLHSFLSVINYSQLLLKCN